MDKRKQNLTWNSSSVSNWSAKWTPRQSWRWSDCKGRWVVCLTCTSTPCLMTTWVQMRSTAPDYSVHGPGRIVRRSWTSSTLTSSSARNTDLTSPFSSRLTWPRKSLRKERTTWQLISCMSFANLQLLQQPSDYSQKSWRGACLFIMVLHTLSLFKHKKVKPVVYSFQTKFTTIFPI